MRVLTSVRTADERVAGALLKLADALVNNLEPENVKAEPDDEVPLADLFRQATELSKSLADAVSKQAGKSGGHP